MLSEQERGRERERGVCLNHKLFFDERKRAPEEGGNMYKPAEEKDRKRAHL